MAPRPTLAAAQFEPAVGDTGTNLETIERVLTGLEDAVEVVVFPELTVTGYDLDAARDLAEPIPGPTTTKLVDLAGTYGVDIVVGIPERTDDHLYNALAYVTPDGLRATYRKQYLWGDEREVFDSGGQPVTVESPVGTVGLLLCYDLNLPETSLAYAREEVDVLAVSGAWRTDYMDDWELLLRARALDGTAYVVAANHVGSQSGRRHGGGSLVVDPTGHVTTIAGETPAVVTTPVEAPVLETARRRNPVLETRRER